MEVRLGRPVPRDCEVTPQGSPVAWGKILYNYAEERSARGCVDIKQLQEQVQRLKGYRLGNAFAEGAVQKIAAVVQEISVRSAQGVAYSRKGKAISSFVVLSSESSSSDSSATTLEKGADLYRQVWRQALPAMLNSLDEAQTWMRCATDWKMFWPICFHYLLYLKL